MCLGGKTGRWRGTSCVVMGEGREAVAAGRFIAGSCLSTGARLLGLPQLPFGANASSPRACCLAFAGSYYPSGREGAPVRLP